MYCWYSFLLFLGDETNYVIKKRFEPTSKFCNFCILLKMWSNWRLSSEPFAIKMHTIVCEVRILLCNKVLQYYQRKTQSLRNTTWSTSESYADITIAIDWFAAFLVT